MYLALGADSSFCIIDGRVVFCDLASRRYFWASTDLDRAFRRLAAQETLSDTDLLVLEPLLAKGILIRTPAARPLCPASIPPALESLLDAEPGPHPGTLPAILISQLKTRALLKVMPLKDIVRQIRTRKSRGVLKGAVVDRGLEQATAHAARHGRRITIAKDQCLVTSISIVNYLATKKIFPDLVFAVRVAPFSAHCWVQSEDRVLSDSIENVHLYTPILVV